MSEETDALWESRLACRKLLSRAKKSRFPDAEEFIAKLIFDAAQEWKDANAALCEELFGIEEWASLSSMELIPPIYRTLAGPPGDMDPYVLGNLRSEAPYGPVICSVGEQLIRLATRKGYMSAERTGKAT